VLCATALAFARSEKAVQPCVVDALDEAAEIAGRCWHAFSQTKQAHERLSPEPFRPTDFGMDYDKAIYSRDCMDRIRDLKRNYERSQP